MKRILRKINEHKDTKVFKIVNDNSIAKLSLEKFQLVFTLKDNCNVTDVNSLIQGPIVLNLYEKLYRCYDYTLTKSKGNFCLVEFSFGSGEFPIFCLGDVPDEDIAQFEINYDNSSLSKSPELYAYVVYYSKKILEHKETETRFKVTSESSLEKLKQEISEVNTSQTTHELFKVEESLIRRESYVGDMNTDMIHVEIENVWWNDFPYSYAVITTNSTKITVPYICSLSSGNKHVYSFNNSPVKNIRNMNIKFYDLNYHELTPQCTLYVRSTWECLFHQFVVPKNQKMSNELTSIYRLM